MRAESEHARCLYFYNINTQDFNAAGSYLNETDLKQNYFYQATLTVASFNKCIRLNGCTKLHTQISLI